MNNRYQKPTLQLYGDDGELTIGGNASDGSLVLVDSEQRATIKLDTDIDSNSDDAVVLANSSEGLVRTGGPRQGGQLALRDGAEKERILLVTEPKDAPIRIDGDDAKMQLGGGEEYGKLEIRDKDGVTKFEVSQTGIQLFD